MQTFIRFTLAQKVVYNLAFVLLILIGALAMLRMPVDRYPNIEFGKMYINTFLPGASPADVERLVTRKIEEALEDVEELDFIRSTSYRERSNVVIKFNDDSDYKKRFDDVRLKVLSISEDLPPLPEPPVFNFLDVNDWFPTISVNISGTHQNKTLALVAEEVKIHLSQIDGVKETRLTGEHQQEFHLLLSAEKMKRYGITFTEAVEQLKNSNISYPAGHLETAVGEFIVKVDEQVKSRDELLSIIIRSDSDGSFIRLADIAAEASFSYQDPFIITSVNGTPCVTLQVLKSSSGNALFIAERVKSLVEELAPVFSDKGISLTVTQDSSNRITDSIRVLGVNLLLGVILICIIIWRFMGFRNAAITTIGIPFAFLVTMIFMYLTGNSINEVSLFAFVLVSGIIVDDAIVVVENIYRHAQADTSLADAVVRGTAEVFLPVVSATLTTALAFLPMLIMTGMVGDFFAIIPKTIVFALIASIFECLLILPCHYLDFGARNNQARTAEGPDQLPLQHYLEGVGEKRGMRAVRSVFNRLVLITLHYRMTTLAVLGAAFGCAVFIFVSSMMGTTNLLRITFFPDNYSLYYVELTGPPGIPISETDKLVRRVAAAVMAEGPAMNESALGFAGFYINDDFSPQYGNNLGHVAVTLPKKNDRKFADYPRNDIIAHLEYIRDKVAPLVPPGTSLSIRPEKDGPPAGKDLNIRTLGTDPETIFRLAEAVKAFLLNDPGIAPWLVDLQDDRGSTGRVFKIDIDHARAAEFRIPVSEIARMASSIINGQVIGEMKLTDEQIDIKVKMQLTGDLPMTEVLDMIVAETPAGRVPLSDLCTAEYSIEPGSLNRFKNQRAITLMADIKPGAPISSQMVVRTVREFYAGVQDHYPGAVLNFSGEHESTKKSFISLSYAFVIALLMIYIVLAAQFRSYLQPLIIISAVVFALTGVVYGTFVSRTLFTINSFVAIVGVTGVVVNDSLVLVAFLNNCYRSGLKRKDALLLATNIRLRPILLTTITTTLGLLPMALGIPEYSLVWGSMAMTFVTGLCTATILTIMVVPVQWDLLVGLSEKYRGQESEENYLSDR